LRIGNAGTFVVSQEIVNGAASTGGGTTGSGRAKYSKFFARIALCQ
jgi:hypothetical protein